MKIKTLLPIVSIIAIGSHALAQENANNTFTITGSLHGTKTDSVILYYSSGAKYEHLAEPVNNGKFQINGKLAGPTQASILFKKRGEVISNYAMNDRMKSVFLDPAAMTIQGDAGNLESIVLKGSKTNEEYKVLQQSTAPVRTEMQPILNALSKEKDHEKSAEIRELLGPFNDRIKAITYKFFKSYPTSYVTLSQMRFYVSSLSLDSSRLIFAGLGKELQNTSIGKEIAKDLRQMENGMPGAQAFVFTKPDINGKQLSLADFQGKYVLLDFWASWCVPCRKGNPHLISLYNKYKEKGFEIIGISDDDRKPEAWKKAVEQDKIGIWKHVLRGLDMEKRMKNIDNPEDISEHYGIHSLPTKILIDPTGKIVGRYGDSIGGTDEDLDKKIASVFN